MTDNSFYQGIKIIETVTNKSFSEDQLEIYKMMLSDIPDVKFLEGIKKLLSERVYSNLPQVAEIRQYCLGTREEELEIKIVKSGSDIKRAIAGIGTHSSIVFDDPILHLVIRDAGGWSGLGKMKIDELDKFIKWELPKLYKLYAGEKNKNIPLLLNGRSYSWEGRNQIFYFGDRDKIDKWQNGYVKKYYHELDYKNMKFIEDLGNIDTSGMIEFKSSGKKFDTGMLENKMTVKEW